MLYFVIYYTHRVIVYRDKRRTHIKQNMSTFQYFIEINNTYHECNELKYNILHKKSLQTRFLYSIFYYFLVLLSSLFII